MSKEIKSEFDELEALEKEIEEASLQLQQQMESQNVEEIVIDFPKKNDEEWEEPPLDELELELELEDSSYEEHSDGKTSEKEEIEKEESENKESENKESENKESENKESEESVPHLNETLQVEDEGIQERKEHNSEHNSLDNNQTELNSGQEKEELKTTIANILNQKKGQIEPEGEMELPEEPSIIGAEFTENNADNKEDIDYFMSEEYKKEKVEEILNRVVEDPNGNKAYLHEIITEKDIWFISETGRPIIHDTGADKIIEFVGADIEEQLIGSPDQYNDRGFYFKSTCILPNGKKAEEYGSANDLNCKSRIAKENKISMAPKRASHRALFKALGFYDFYSSSESDDFNRVEMIRKKMTEAEKEHREEKKQWQNKIIELEEQIRSYEGSRIEVANYKIALAKQKKKQQNLLDFSQKLYKVLEENNLSSQFINSEDETIRQYTQSLVNLINKKK